MQEANKTQARFYRGEAYCSLSPLYERLLAYANSTESDVSGVVCTDFAIKAARRFGGRVYGFYAEDNPNANLGSICGGHDFSVIGDYICDPWIVHVLGEQKKYPPVLRRDDARARRNYGDPAKWTEIALPAVKQEVRDG